MEKHRRQLALLKNISVEFNQISILKDVSLEIRAGEIHALVGENGAGKSTLMKTILGIISPTHGEVIFLDKIGVSMVHQEILLIPELSIAENIFLGREHSFGFFPWQKDKNILLKTIELLDEYDIELDPKTLVKNLSTANQQLVEILKAVSQNSQLILMDEPTSSLSEAEVQKFINVIQKLKTEGVGMIFTSHKMNEIFSLSDHISVLRDGSIVSSNPINQITEKETLRQMVGREIQNYFPERNISIGSEILSVKNLSRKDQKFQNINFELKKGEVLGIAGLMGAGRTELGMVIGGITKNHTGEISLNGSKVNYKSPKDAIREGIGYVGEDRKESGFIPEFTIPQNISLSSLHLFQKFGWIQKEKELKNASSAIQKFNIKHLFKSQTVQKLSGGNQQKVVLAKVLQNDPEIIILDEPTRGIDVQAKFEIYQLMNELLEGGKSILLISSDLPELIHMSDRVLVLSKGKQTAILEKEQIKPEEIIHFAMQ